MADYQIGDGSHLSKRIGHVDQRITIMQTTVARVDGDVRDLRAAIKQLNNIVASLRIQVSDLKRSPIPDEVFRGVTAPGERYGR